MMSTVFNILNFTRRIRTNELFVDRFIFKEVNSYVSGMGKCIAQNIVCGTTYLVCANNCHRQLSLSSCLIIVA